SAGTVREVGSRVGEAMVSRSFQGRRARPPHSGWEHVARGAVPGRGTAWERTRGPDRPGRRARVQGGAASTSAAGGPAARGPVHGTTACSTAAHSSSTTSLREYELDQVHRV